jgi:hypothetical protein
LQHEGTFGAITAASSSDAFIRVDFGVAIEVPLSTDLAYRVACGNKHLDVGRIYR